MASDSLLVASAPVVDPADTTKPTEAQAEAVAAAAPNADGDTDTSAHWNGPLYFNKDNDNLLVPKRNPWMGWTINFGHRAAPIVLLGIILLPVALVELKHRGKLPRIALPKFK